MDSLLPLRLVGEQSPDKAPSMTELVRFQQGQPYGRMRLFNAIQIVVLFGAFPFLLNWLSTNPFQYGLVAFWLALVAYIVFFVWITYMVFKYLDNSESKK